MSISHTPPVISGHEDNDPDPYALNIIVEDTKNYTNDELIKIVAASVIKFVPVPQHMEENSNFSIWVQGRFRKLLKRMKPAYFKKLPQELKENNITFSQFSEGNIQLIVIEPLRKSFTLPVLKRAQVSGLTTIDPRIDETEKIFAKMYGNFDIVLNKELDMSVSKAAIAAAHALQMLRDKLYEEDKISYDILMRNMPIAITWKNIDKETADNQYSVVIRDAGLTEVEPGSITATIKENGSFILR